MPQTPSSTHSSAEPAQATLTASAAKPETTAALAPTHTAGAAGARSGLNLRNSFAALGPVFSTALLPTPLPSPQWVGRNDRVAAQVGLDSLWWQSDAALQAFTGNTVLPGSQPLASVYSGHQFGVWAGQLGDGRAILLGDTDTDTGLELQLKGAGRTPYSRGGDGRAVLRSSIREYLCSIAMRGLGIATTDALCVIGSPQAVRRETVESAAVVTRVAPSFIRFGHFEHFASRDMLPELRQLADYVIDRHYPSCRDSAAGSSAKGNPYAALLARVTERTALLLADWQAIGFCHGVMNTDNMSILGLTIDYGPFQFLDAFVPGHVCNHSDTQGRYAFNRQPNVAYWNLYCLGQALMPLIEDQALAVAALEPYRTAFPQAFEARMAAKLGMDQVREGDGALIDGVLALLAAGGIDYTIFWRRLSEHVAGAPLDWVRDLAPDRTAFDPWMLLYSERIAQVEPGQSANLMLKTNPKFVLRNHLGEMAIRAAHAGDFGPIGTLQHLLESPYDDHPGFDTEAGFPPDWASTIEISCSS